MKFYEKCFYRVSLFRVFELYKCEAPEMKENKQ